ncbi:MAG TPA: hypothetical protein VF815_21100 [Myxococcaceae bacterium]
MTVRVEWQGWQGRVSAAALGAPVLGLSLAVALGLWEPLSPAARGMLAPLVLPLAALAGALAALSARSGRAAWVRVGVPTLAAWAAILLFTGGLR